MKLLPIDIRAQLPPLYSQDGKKDAMVIVKFFDPTGAATFYATEFDGEDLFFGFVDMGDPTQAEEGYFSLKELESMQLEFGLGIERDLYFSQRPLSKVIEETKARI
jgi:cold shock CspA family protein